MRPGCCKDHGLLCCASGEICSRPRRCTNMHEGVQGVKLGVKMMSTELMNDGVKVFERKP